MWAALKLLVEIFRASPISAILAVGGLVGGGLLFGIYGAVAGWIAGLLLPMWLDRSTGVRNKALRWTVGIGASALLLWGAVTLVVQLTSP
jgi:hypothetical protein